MSLSDITDEVMIDREEGAVVMTVPRLRTRMTWEAAVNIGVFLIQAAGEVQQQMYSAAPEAEGGGGGDEDDESD